MRSDLWPTHAPAELAKEVESYLAGDGLWSFGGQSIPFAVFVATRPTEGTVGFVEASLRPFADGCRTSPVGYLEALYVAPSSRRMGVGRALVRAAEEWALGHGCREMASDANVGNLGSELAHRALGYETVHRIVHFRRALR